MDKERVRKMLPEQPPRGLRGWALENCEDDLGPQYVTFRSETVPVYPDLREIMEYNSMAPRRKRRAAMCSCLACGEDFVTEVLPGAMGIKLFVGEDGQSFTMDPGASTYTSEDSDSMGYTVELGEGDSFLCPLCFSEVSLIHKKRLKGGRRKQILVISVERVGEYAAVVYWLVYRDIYPELDTVGVYPRDAYVLTEHGGLVRYTHVRGGGICHETDDGCWTLCSGNRDTYDKAYLDWNSINNRKAGGWFYPVAPDLTGTTGEKTGLAAYCKRNSVALVPYLKLWRRWRKVENLVNTGWTKLVETAAVRNCYGHDPMAELAQAVDMSKSKPYEIMGMSRADFKTIRKGNLQWDLDEQQVYMRCREACGIGAAEFLARHKQFGRNGIWAMIDLNRLYGEVSFEKVERYLSKQSMQPDEAGILLDTWNMAKDLAGGRALTNEELWPRNLRQTHDRLTRMKMEKIDKAAAEKYQQGFDLIVDKYGELEWTDGDLCVRLPRSNGELVMEGKILRHCVGGYGQSHIAQKDVIFFIRNYRRPERSYYTLDMRLLDKPERVQLHGYGNERHGDKKQYVHKIPRKVLDFCDRWEKEILMPWWYEYQRKLEKGKELCKRA